MMKKSLLIGFMLVMTGVLTVAPPAWCETSDWFGPYGSQRPNGVYYQYEKSSWASDYDTVKFENRNTVKVKVDYVTQKYPKTNHTLYLEAKETSSGDSIVQGDRLKEITVTIQ
jgi:hypothetical protein